jgi:hypothetical protein
LARSSPFGQLFLFIFVFQNTVSLGSGADAQPALADDSHLPGNHLPAGDHVGRGNRSHLDPDARSIIGIVNPVLRDIGSAHGSGMASDQDWAMRTVMLVQAAVERDGGRALPGRLQNVPRISKQARLVDGARRWQVFRDITFPCWLPPSQSSRALVHPHLRASI